MQKMHRVIAEFVVPRLEMFSQSVVRHRQSESRLNAVPCNIHDSRDALILFLQSDRAPHR